MKILYANKNVEKCFTDIKILQKKVPVPWIKKILQYKEVLGVANDFGEFLNLKIGRPEMLKGYKKPTYSIRITGNVRMIIELEEDNSIRLCRVVEMKGVVDYHGDKENWYIY